MKRREFFATAGLGALVSGVANAQTQPTTKPTAGVGDGGAVVISTWRHGVAANVAALAVLGRRGHALDAVEAGVMVSEGDPAVSSVGYGGLPNAEGVVELDASIMDGITVEAGSVASLRDIKHPVAVARRVMEKTRHVLLVGAGAREFALAQGFTAENLLTDKAKKRYHEWLASKGRRVPGQVDDEDHDTIGMVALDSHGHLAAACTTSGLAWKIPGRVGDSPLVGHGMYCDGKAGGAAATGIGEEVIKVCGSYQVVEFMRQGRSPQEAIDAVLARVVARDPKNRKRQVGFVAVRKDGAIGYGSIQPGFQAAIARVGVTDGAQLIDAPSLVKKAGGA